MILDVDAGNTRIKWRAMADSGERIAGGSAAVVDAFADISQQLSAPARVRIASVRNSEFRARLQERVMDQWGVVAEFAQSREQVGRVRNAYAEPGHLGVDRWLAVLSAYDRARGACCVLDAGSALTLDIVQRNGQHEGGYIVPGLTMQRSALLERTAIPLATSGRWGDTDPGRSTVAAIHHGILDMVVSWVAEHYRVRLPQDCAWFITGGDAEVLSEALVRRGVRCTLVPELVLEGLSLALP